MHFNVLVMFHTKIIIPHKQFYSGVSSAQLMLMRHMILELFQDTNKRVCSVYM